MAVHTVTPMLHAAASDIGWLAAAIVLIAYALLMTGRTTPTSIGYLLANAAGSAGLGLSMAAVHAWQSVLVNTLWLAFGLVPLVRQLRARRHPHLTVAVGPIRPERHVERDAEGAEPDLLAAAS